MTKRSLLVIATALSTLMLLWPWKHVATEADAMLLWNWGHAPLFGALAWLLSRRGESGTSTWQRAAGDLRLLSLAAVGIEFLQGFTGRTQDWRDILSGFLGATAGTSWGIATNQGPTPTRGRLVALIVSGISAAFSLQPLAAHGLALREYSRQFPVLGDFERRRSLQLWALEINGVPTRLTESVMASGKGIWESTRQIELPLPAHGRVSLHHSTQGRDWRGATALTFDYELRANAGELLRLGVRIDGGQGSTSRLRLDSLLKTGKHRGRVELPRSTASDAVLAKTHKLVLFAHDPGFDASLFLDNIRLELE